MISTRDLSKLPHVDGLRRLMQSMALLDAILCPDWQFRFYSFNCRWAPGEQLGSMRNAMGDDFFALFNARGCFLKGFAHEAPMSPYGRDPIGNWPGVLDAVPTDFADCLTEPAFSIQHTTFCLWRRYEDTAWQQGKIDFPVHKDPDGSAYLLSPLDANPETYREWATWYFSKPFLTVEMIRPIYEYQPLTDEMVAALTPDVVLEDPENPHLGVADIEDDVVEIGYPV
jgi:hypothetical protein